LNAPQRFPPGRFAVIEPIGLTVHDWSRPQRGGPRMFDQNFFEWFSHIHPASVVSIYLSWFAWVIWKTVDGGLSPAGIAVRVVAGCFAWTLVEYVIHRFSFHYVPRGRVGMFYAYTVHGFHHAFPEDHRRWLTPPVFSMPIAFGLHLVLRSLLGIRGSAFFAGGLIGYLLYDLSHYLIHRGRPRSALLNRLRQRHLQHHYATPDRWYGVSTPLWDYIFRTTAPVRRDAPSS
jgi:hypothetical protein